LSNHEKIQAQESEYAFPYHYIPHPARKWGIRRHRVMKWAFEYLCYQYHVIDLIRSLNPESVLEVGCGDGFMIGSLGEAIPRRAGADFSERAILFARAFHPGVKFHAGDAADVEGEFDVVAAVEVVEHIPDEGVSGFLRTLFEKTRSGGKVVISVPSVVVPVNHKKHFRHYTAKLMKEQLREAGIDFRVLSEEFIYKLPLWLRLYNKLTLSRHWTLEVRAFNRWIWRLVWNRYRKVSESEGHHVVMVFEKP
jgi:SAM-dependent methyltransferase